MVAAPSNAWVALGGNQGDSRTIFQSALSQLTATSGIELVAASSLYRTPPWGDEAQPPFLNAVVRMRTDLDALSLLRVLQTVEEALGRQRDPERRWGPRTLDLDVLLTGQARIDTPARSIVTKITANEPRTAKPAPGPM